MSEEKKKVDDGGPAYPRMTEWNEDYRHLNGMSMLDHFAGQALASGECPHNMNLKTAIAEWSYDVAEAMIAERNKRKA